MKTIWERIHAWLQGNAGEVYLSLREGASEADIAFAEQALGQALPEEVKVAYRTHDGQEAEGETGTAPALVHGLEWYSLRSALSLWAILKKHLENGVFQGAQSHPQGPIRADWWHPGWVPLVGDDATLHCVDLAPLPGGRAGQMIAWHNDGGANRVVAASFAEYLALFAEALERDDYGCLEGWHGLVHRRSLRPGQEFAVRPLVLPQGDS